MAQRASSIGDNLPRSAGVSLEPERLAGDTASLMANPRRVMPMPNKTGEFATRAHQICLAPQRRAS